MLSAVARDVVAHGERSTWVCDAGNELETALKMRLEGLLPFFAIATALLDDFGR
jgi:hypothetical protein